MAEKTELETAIGLNAHTDAERPYYLNKLGKDDLIPGTDMTIEEGEKVYAEANKKAEEALRASTARYYERQQAKGNTNALPVTEAVQTTVVSPVAPLVNVKVGVSGLENLNPVLPVETDVQIVVPTPAGGDDVFPEYTREQLEALEAPKKEKLVAIAVALGIEGNQIPTKNEDLVNLILKTQEDRRKPTT